jgi:NADPH2:quinone reductase
MMAEQTVVSRAWCLPVPDGVDDSTAAALPNPALSSWLPLIWRAQLKPGETVLILGATGVAGKLALQVAKRWQHSPYSHLRGLPPALGAGCQRQTPH